VNGSHVESVTENEGDFVLSAKISEPVPGEDALDGDGDVVTVRGDSVEEGFWLSGDVSMENDLSVVVEDAEVHGSGVEIDATVIVMFSCVESHEVSSLMMGPGLRAQSGYHPVVRWGPQ
jgi:hypothetical protein